MQVSAEITALVTLLRAALERAAVIASLRMVDHVVEYDDVSPFEVIAAVRPHVFCATHDKLFTAAQLGRLTELGVEFRILTRPRERSTSDLIQEIRR